MRRRYQLQQRIAAGAHGTVWRAFDRQRRRTVAIKVSPEHPDAETEHRILQERRFRFDHPHVISAEDTFEHRGRLGFVMPYAEMGDLTSVVERQGPLDENDAARLATEILGALVFLHGRDVLHRDVKPSNVLFRAGADGTAACLADLGSAVDRNGPRLTAHLTLPGTAGYMAPEIEAGRDASEVSDLFSLGRTLEFALTGSTATGVDVASLGGPLATLLPSLLARDPMQRPRDAAAALRVLDGASSDPIAITGVTVGARDDESVGPRREWSPGRAVRVVGLLLVGALVGFVVGRWTAPAEDHGLAAPATVSTTGLVDGLADLVGMIDVAYHGVGPGSPDGGTEEPISLRNAFTTLATTGGNGFVAAATPSPTLVPETLKRGASAGGHPATLRLDPTPVETWRAALEATQSARTIGLKSFKPGLADSRLEASGMAKPDGQLNIGVIPPRTVLESRVDGNRLVQRRTPWTSERSAKMLRALRAAAPMADIRVLTAVVPNSVDVLVDLRGSVGDETAVGEGWMPSLTFDVATNDAGRVGQSSFTASYGKIVSSAATQLGASDPSGFVESAASLPPRWHVDGLLASAASVPSAGIATLGPVLKKALGTDGQVVLCAAAATTADGVPDGWLTWPQVRSSLQKSDRGTMLVVVSGSTNAIMDVRDQLARAAPDSDLVALIAGGIGPVV